MELLGEHAEEQETKAGPSTHHGATDYCEGVCKMGQRGGDPGQDAVSVDREPQKEDIEKSFPKTVTEESR